MSPERRHQFKKPYATSLVVAVPALGLGVAAPLAEGLALGTVTVVGIAALMLGVAVTYLPERIRMPGYFLVLIVGALVVGTHDRRVSEVWLGLVLAGIMAGLALRYALESGRPDRPRPGVPLR